MKAKFVMARSLVGLCLVAATACGGIQNHPAVEALEGGKAKGAGDTLTFVEAYIEYPGPQEKWAGPSSFILHVVAQGSGAAQISVTPDWFAGRAPVQQTDRRPASVLTEASKAAVEVPQTRPLGSEAAREKIRFLASAIESGVEEPFRGCLSPVRMRLIRADGTVVEKTGCRSEKGWTRAASDAVEFFMSALVKGVSA